MKRGTRKGFISQIPRILVWMLLIGLVILSAWGTYFWWPKKIRRVLIFAVAAVTLVNVIIDIRVKKSRRPAGKLLLLSVIATIATSIVCWMFRWGWAPVITTAYFIWRFMPWKTGSAGTGGTGSSGGTGTGGTGSSGGITNGIIDICLPLTRVSIPKWFYQIRVDNYGMAYWIIPTLFGRIRMPSDLSICADPDLSWEWTQLAGRTARIVMKREKKIVPLVFWVREEHAMNIISILSGQITVACETNHKKRFVPPS